MVLKVIFIVPEIYELILLPLSVSLGVMPSLPWLVVCEIVDHSQAIKWSDSSQMLPSIFRFSTGRSTWFQFPILLT